MTPTTVNLTIYIGATLGPHAIACRDVAGDLVDLTGWSAWAHVRKSSSDELIADLNPVIEAGAGGVITIELTDEDTAELPKGAYSWDLILENPDGERRKYVAGRVRITPNITQPA